MQDDARVEAVAKVIAGRAWNFTQQQLKDGCPISMMMMRTWWEKAEDCIAAADAADPLRVEAGETCIEITELEKTLYAAMDYAASLDLHAAEWLRDYRLGDEKARAELAAYRAELKAAHERALGWGL